MRPRLSRSGFTTVSSHAIKSGGRAQVGLNFRDVRINLLFWNDRDATPIEFCGIVAGVYADDAPVLTFWRQKKLATLACAPFHYSAPSAPSSGVRRRRISIGSRIHLVIASQRKTPSRPWATSRAHTRWSFRRGNFLLFRVRRLRSKRLLDGPCNRDRTLKPALPE